MGYDHKKSEAAKQAAKKAEILATETYKKTHAQKLIQASKLYVADCINIITVLLLFYYYYYIVFKVAKVAELYFKVHCSQTRRSRYDFR